MSQMTADLKFADWLCENPPKTKELSKKELERECFVNMKVINSQQGRIRQLEAELQEWKNHNAQRLEEVYAARQLVGAQPNETLPQAILRRLAALLPDALLAKDPSDVTS